MATEIKQTDLNIWRGGKPKPEFRCCAIGINCLEHGITKGFETKMW